MLSRHLNSLALFLYSDNPLWSHTETVAKSTWATFETLQEKPIRAKKRKALQAMVFLAMQEWKHYSQTGKTVHSPIKVRELLGLSEHHWHRDWSPHWQQLKQIIRDDENRVLEYVYNNTKTARMDNKEVAAA